MDNHTNFPLHFLKNFNDEVDFRLRDRFLMSSPYILFSICAFYFVLTYWLKNFMSRNPKYVINTEPITVIYFVCVLIKTTELFWRTVRYMQWSNFNFRCMAVDKSTQPEVIDVKNDKNMKMLTVDGVVIFFLFADCQCDIRVLDFEDVLLPGNSIVRFGWPE